jgi:tol-pal system protein YbgF
MDLVDARLAAIKVLLASRMGTSSPRPGPSVVPKDLATVRLVPQEKAPPLATAVKLREPDAEAMARMMGDGVSSSGSPEMITSEEAEFQAALMAISTGDVEGGAAALTAFADAYPKHERASAALYNAGLGLQNYGDLKDAVLRFERVADDYPIAPEAPDAMIRMAECQARLKNLTRARDLYARVIGRYPGSAAARSAEVGLKSLGGASQPATQ